ncbi:hypothetical protein [Ruegeria sp. HU-ET01832]|uniref:hypothetical protein n=1 Tax=Ruegeria sp. HU-ET01832 TaxID=3135906 RepID=UPI003341189B
MPIELPGNTHLHAAAIASEGIERLREQVERGMGHARQDWNVDQVDLIQTVDQVFDDA